MPLAGDCDGGGHDAFEAEGHVEASNAHDVLVPLPVGQNDNALGLGCLKRQQGRQTTKFLRESFF